MSNPPKGTSGQETTSLPTSPNARTTSPLPHGSETSFTSCSNDAERPAPGTPSSTTSSLPTAKQPRILLTPAAETLCQRVYELSRGADETLCPGPWDPFPFARTDWESLQAFLTAVGKQDHDERCHDRFSDTVFGFYHDKLHLSYFSDTELAVFRMPARKHELFLYKVIDEIKSGIRKCITRSRRKKYKNNTAYIEAAAYAQLVEYTASSRLFYTVDGAGSSRPGLHDPDGSFCFMAPSSRNPVPGLIIEISHSQKRKALAKLADHYLLCTDGPDVQLVLAFDLSYHPSEQGACVICFRRKSEICDGKEVVSVVQEEHPFRDDRGRPLPGKVRFFLSDLGRPTLENIPDYVQQLTLDFEKLNEFLVFAEERTGTQSEREAQRLQWEQILGQPAVEEARNPRAWGENVLKRHRESSSPEQIAEEDEQKIQRAEPRAAKRARKGDRLYHPGHRVTPNSGTAGELEETPRSDHDLT